MILLLVMMAAISSSLRTLPFIFSKWLGKWTLLEKLSATLPLCISILLVAHLLEETPFKAYPYGIPEIVGLFGVAITQIVFRTILISMGVGIAAHQALLYLLN